MHVQLFSDALSELLHFLTQFLDFPVGVANAGYVYIYHSKLAVGSDVLAIAMYYHNSSNTL